MSEQISLLEVPTEPKPGDVIAVWFSCGAASAVALKETIERYPQCEIRALNNFILEEDIDNRRFLNDVSNWLGIEIEIVRSPTFPNGSIEEIWDHRRYMSGVKGAPCTQELKFNARLYWQRFNRSDWMVVGFTSNEKRRYSDLKQRVPNLLPVLIEAGISKGDCFRIVTNAGLKLPRIYDLGYPNANCPGCVKSSSPTYWNHVRKVHPEIFDKRAYKSRELGVRLVKLRGERIFLDELKTSDQGRPLKDMDFECGIFCPNDD